MDLIVREAAVYAVAKMDVRDVRTARLWACA